MKLRDRWLWFQCELQIEQWYQYEQHRLRLIAKKRKQIALLQSQVEILESIQ